MSHAISFNLMDEERFDKNASSRDCHDKEDPKHPLTQKKSAQFSLEIEYFIPLEHSTFHSSSIRHFTLLKDCNHFE